MWAWREVGPRRAAMLGMVFGAFTYGVLLSWIFYFGAVAMVPLLLAMSAIIAGTGALDAWLRGRGVRRAWVLASVWTLFELGRSRFPLGGLPWGDMGVALHDVPAARALASVGGVPLVTFLVVLTNALLLDAILAVRARRGRTLLASVGKVAIVAAITVAVSLTWSRGPARGTLRIAALQGNDLNRDLTPEEENARYLPAAHFALADSLTGSYDLIVFPESSFDKDPATDKFLTRNVKRVAEERNSYLLVNAPVPSPDGRNYNANIMFDPDGQAVGIYAKRHLVPFGEYVPLRRYLDWIPAIDQIPYDYAPGHGDQIFDVRGTGVVTVICFESAFSNLTRGVVRDGAEIIVVSTNNASYRRSANTAQHLAISQMRAAETGRPIVHAAISGITAFVDPEGNVTQQTAMFEPASISAMVTGRGGQTPYVRYGDWAAGASALVVLGAVVIALRRGDAGRRRS